MRIEWKGRPWPTTVFNPARAVEETKGQTYFALEKKGIVELDSKTCLPIAGMRVVKAASSAMKATVDQNSARPWSNDCHWRIFGPQLLADPEHQIARKHRGFVAQAGYKRGPLGAAGTSVFKIVVFLHVSRFNL